MIEFKQKEFKTGAIAKVAFRKGKIKEGLKEFKSIMNKDYLKPGAASKKTKYQLMRDAVEEEHKFKGKVKQTVHNLTTKEGLKNTALNTYEKGRKTVDYIKHTDPGTIVADKVVEPLIKRPIAVGGTVGGYVPLAYGVYIPGTTPMAISADMGARKLLPTYDKVTNKLGAAYEKPRGKKGNSFRDLVKKGTNAAVETLKNIPA